VTAAGAKALRLPVKNFGLFWEHDGEAESAAAASADADKGSDEEGEDKAPKAVSRSTRRQRLLVNRVEVGTAFDFKRVTQILVSEPVACPVKPGYNYVNVVLVVPAASGGVAPVLLMPYLYDTSYGRANNLSEWELINSKMETARHRVAAFR
jgi:hypothetical protein